MSDYIYLFNGKVSFIQPEETAYRFSEDAAWLACAIEANNHQTALELGLGTGALALCTAYRFPQLKITALEKQPEMLQSAQKNIALNKANIQAIHANILTFNSAEKYQLAFSNPPFYLEDKHSLAQDNIKRHAHSFTDTHITDWLNLMHKQTTQEATLYVINHIMHEKTLENWAQEQNISLDILYLKTSKTKGIKRFIARLKKSENFSKKTYEVNAFEEAARNHCLRQAQSIWDIATQVSS